MEKLVLTDKSVVPDDALVFAIIGDTSVLWQQFMRNIHEKYPETEEQWNFYNDGKSWLFRMVRKKKTLFWIGVYSSYFRVTFYFGDKALPLIDKSDLPETLKKEFKDSKSYGRFRGLSIRVRNEKDIENAAKLTDIKIKV